MKTINLSVLFALTLITQSFISSKKINVKPEERSDVIYKGNSVSDSVEINNIQKKSQQKAALVDFEAYDKLVDEVKEHRKSRLLNFQEFIKTSKEQNVIILDTRSDSMYASKHLKGALHLNFADFTQENLAKIIPSTDYKILIYCNNNFADDRIYFPTKAAFPKVSSSITKDQKALTLALNIPTYINLYGYGYKNVFELNELVSVFFSEAVFEGTEVANTDFK